MSKTSERAYRMIRSGILDGHFQPGSFVPEDEIAQYCGLSRTPVREAISQLTSEMLLQRSETNRVYVPVWSDADDEEMFALRGLLESHSAARAARLITAEQIETLQMHFDYIEAAIHRDPTPNVSDFVEGNRRFHLLIMQAAQSERLAKLLKLLVSQVVIHRTAERYDLSDMVRSQNDHSDLMAAFRARDSDWAASIADNHIRRAANAYRQYHQLDRTDARAD